MVQKYDPNRRQTTEFGFAAVFLLFYVLYFIQLQVGEKRMGSATLTDEIFSLVLIPFAVIGFARCSSKLPRLIALYFVFYFLSTAVALSIGNSNYPINAVYLGVALETKPFVFIFAIFYFLRSNPKQRIAAVIHLLLSLALINSVFCIADLSIGNSSGVLGFPLLQGTTMTYAPSGMFSHKTSSAVLTAAGVISALSIARTKAVLYVIAFYLIVVLAMHSAAKEFIAILIAVVAFVSFPPNPKSGFRNAWAPLMFSAAAIGATMLAIPTLKDRANSYVLAESGRSMLYDTSWALSQDNFPLGSGAGSFGSAPSRQLYFSDIYHDYGLSRYYGLSPEASSYIMDTWWPKILGESGIIGFAANFIFWIILWKKGVHLYLTLRTAETFFLLGLYNLVMISSVGAAVFTSVDFLPILGIACAGILTGASWQVAR